MLRSYSLLALFGFSLLMLQACGGGGGGSSSSAPSYSGLTSEARIEDANAQDLGNAAVSGARQSVVAETAEGVFVPRSAPALENKLVEIAPQIAKWFAESEAYASRTTDVSMFCSVSGSAIANTNDAGTEGTITFTNCGISDGNGGVVTLSGTVAVSYTLVNNTIDSMEMTFHVSVSFGGETASISMSLSCVGLTGVGSCTVSSDFVGIDDRVYRVTDITVSGSAASGYSIGATVYDPAHGSVTMTTTVPLLFNCANGVPGAGTLELFGSNGTSAVIAFVSCSEYNITVDTNPATTYYW